MSADRTGVAARAPAMTIADAKRRNFRRARALVKGTRRVAQFADPAYDLSVDGLAAREAVHAAQHGTRTAPARAAT